MKELELFFEKVKESKVEEFKSQFENIITKYKNKNYIIDELIRYFNKYRKDLNAQKQTANEEDYKSLQISVIKCKKIINYLKMQYNIKNTDHKETSVSKKKNLNVDTNSYKKEKSKYLDDYKLKTYLQQLSVAEDKTLVLSNIIKLYKEAKEKETEKYTILCSKKDSIIRMLKVINNETTISAEREYLLELKKTFQKIGYLNKKENYYNNLLTTNNEKKNRKSIIEYVKEKELSNNQEIIENSLINNIDIDLKDFDLIDILYSYGHYIKNCQINNQVASYGRKISYSFFDEDFEINDDILKGLYYILDCLKMRISNTNKESRERKLLKEIQREYHCLLQIYKKETRKVTNSYFSTIEYLMSNENNIITLKALINTIPDIVNTTYIKEDKTVEHIIFYIIEEFISNYKILIKNKKDKYINPNYLREIYFIFIRNYNISLTTEQKIEIDKKLSQFISYVNKYIKSPTRRLAVKMDLKPMYTSNIYSNNRKYDSLKYVDNYQLDNDLNSLHNNLKYSLLDKERVDLTVDNNITFNNSPYCYSISKYYDKKILKVNVIDIYSIINGNKNLENYILNQTISKEEIDDMLIGITSMNESETYPTITYEITVDNNGNYKNLDNTFIGFNIYKSKVKINKNYNNDDLIDSDDETLKPLKGLYNKLKVRNKFNYQGSPVEVLDKCFTNLLNEGIINFVKENNLPFIYSGYKNYDMINIINDLDYLLPKNNKEYICRINEELKKYENILTYSLAPFNGIYTLPINNPVSYQGLLIQEILNRLFIKCNDTTEKEYLDTYEMLRNNIEIMIERVNSYNEYIDEDKLREEKGKLKKYYISKRNIV